ncbi:MAG: hypothetical protein K2M34_01820 [Alphaproteobacteria bacterium]|nr:hypothetical protein [Alphaproteobacteria bacterium]
MTDKRAILKRKILFKNSTKALKKQALRIKSRLRLELPYDIVDTILRMRAAFRKPEIRKQILNTNWEQINLADARYSEGFCSVASYIIGHAFRDPTGPSPWRFRQFKDEKTFGNHIWLEFIPTGERFDITFDQFTDSHGIPMSAPYNSGKRANANYKHEKAYKLAEFINPELAAALRRNTMDM